MKKSLLIVLPLFLLNVSHRKVSQFNKATVLTIESGERVSEVVSYENILKSYYDFATNNVKSPTEDFSTFMDEFYSPESDRNLIEHTLSLAEDNGNYLSVKNTLNINTKIRKSSSGSSQDNPSSDADYILLDTYDYSITPTSAFKRAPRISSSIFNYSNVQNGDIIYETETILFNAGHNALIDNISKPSESYGNYIQTVEAVSTGVKLGFLDDQRMAFYKCKILRVAPATSENISDAIYFAKAQLGKPYSLNTFRLNTSINSTEWYCSELVYACYKYAGIDIGVKHDSNGNNQYLQLGCLPKDIYDSYNTYEISMPSYGYLSLSIVKKEWSTWTIKITNTSSVAITANYNKKMCLYNDAKNWTNLIDIASKHISAFSSTNVEIKENFFSTSITTSFIIGPYRVITCADQLNNSNKTLVEHHNVI